MANVTLTQVIDQLYTVVNALTPTVISVPKFERAPKRYTIREWALEQNSGSATFRKYEIRRAGDDVDVGVQDPSARRVEETLMLTMAYPTNLVGIFGKDDLEDVEEIMRKDAKQIRDAVYSPGNYLDGVQSQVVTIAEPERDDEKIWFSVLLIRCLFQEAQTLT